VFLSRSSKDCRRMWRHLPEMLRQGHNQVKDLSIKNNSTISPKFLLRETV
jgi:hypothetical protein